jgi:hypothetical protein
VGVLVPPVPVPPPVAVPPPVPPLPEPLVPPEPLRGAGVDDVPPLPPVALFAPGAFAPEPLAVLDVPLVLDVVAPVVVPGAPLVQLTPVASGAEAGTAFGAILGPASAAKASFGASVPMSRAVGMAVRAMARPTGRWMRPRTVCRGAA